MRESEFGAFLEQTVRLYAEENIRAGYWQRSEATRRSRDNHNKLLPDGLETPGHQIFVVRDDPSQEAVGYIWLKVEKEALIPSGFIYALFIQEQFRGKGYGTRAMQGMEAKSAELGLRRLMLHVFADNPVALHLYESSGYRVTSLNMMREIPQ